MTELRHYKKTDAATILGHSLPDGMHPNTVGKYAKIHPECIVKRLDISKGLVVDIDDLAAKMAADNPDAYEALDVDYGVEMERRRRSEACNTDNNTRNTGEAASYTANEPSYTDNGGGVTRVTRSRETSATAIVQPGKMEELAGQFRLAMTELKEEIIIAGDKRYETGQVKIVEKCDLALEQISELVASAANAQVGRIEKIEDHYIGRIGEAEKGAKSVKKRATLATVAAAVLTVGLAAGWTFYSGKIEAADQKAELLGGKIVSLEKDKQKIETEKGAVEKVAAQNAATIEKLGGELGGLAEDLRIERERTGEMIDQKEKLASELETARRETQAAQEAGQTEADGLKTVIEKQRWMIAEKERSDRQKGREEDKTGEIAATENTDRKGDDGGGEKEMTLEEYIDSLKKE